MAAPEERLVSEGEGGAPGSARLSPAPLPEAAEPLAPMEPPPQSNTLMGLPIVAIESILSFLSYDETSQLRLVGAAEGRRRGGGRAAAGTGLGPPGSARLARGSCGGRRPWRAPPSCWRSPGKGLDGVGWGFIPSPLSVCASIREFLKLFLLSLTSFIPFALCEKAPGCWRLISASDWLGWAVYCVSYVCLFLLIRFKHTSVGGGKPADPRILPCLEMWVKKNAKKKKKSAFFLQS